jgi:O-antigen/teichoic acid export membrane protein
MFITFILMMGMAAVAKPLILTLIGAKWASSIIYLQLLCFSAMLYPLQALNLNMLNVKGRSDLFLKLEIIKKLLAIPVIFVAIFLGIKAMLIGFIILSFASYFLNAYWSGRLIDYSIKEQVMDIVPSFLLALFMGFIVFGLGYFVPLKPLYLLLLQFSLGAFITISFSKIIKLEEYMMIREIVLSKLSVLKKLFHANE